MSLRFLFIDFNSFFASVEQQENPLLRGKPVAVVPVISENTGCIAVSYEAKKIGIKRGMIAREAKERCPEITILGARPSLYVHYHHKLIDVVDSCIPVHTVKSIDEMACELSGSQKNRENAIALAKKIKQEIVKNVGDQIKASIGIAPNIFLAKTASDMQKPNGLVLIEEKDLPDILYSLELIDLTGIGRNMTKRLFRNGIYTIEQLCNAEKEMLRKVWGGIEGDRMFERLRGNEVIVPHTHHTTIGHSHVLAPSERTIESAIAVMHRILQKAAMRLRKVGYRTSMISADIGFYDKKNWNDDISITETSDTLQLTQALTTLFERIPKIKEKPLQVGVSLLHLTPDKDHTISMFENEDRSSALFSVVDELNLRFGKAALYFGGAHTALESSPAKIAFNHIPDIEIEEGKGGRAKQKRKEKNIDRLDNYESLDF